MADINPGDEVRRNPIPSKAAAYDAVRELNGWGHAATVYTWIEGVWVLYEVAEPVTSEADLMATEPRKDER